MNIPHDLADDPAFIEYLTDATAAKREVNEALIRATNTEDAGARRKWALKARAALARLVAAAAEHPRVYLINLAGVERDLGALLARSGEACAL